jgi:hypothetical protein
MSMKAVTTTAVAVNKMKNLLTKKSTSKLSVGGRSRINIPQAGPPVDYDLVLS